MMKNFLFILFLFIFNIVVSQTVYLKINTGTVKMSDGSVIVVNGTNTDAIQNSGGYLISEEQINKIKWFVSTNTGNYIVPFTNINGTTVKIEYNISTAGIGSGFINFSVAPTRITPSDDNKLISTNLYPTPVTNMNDINGIDNSINAINRFWIIDPIGYTTKPSGTIKLYYSDIDLSTMLETNLQSQYWNNSTNIWVLPPSGTVDVSNNNVYNIPSNNNATVWTLVNKDYPLPLDLLFFKVDCQIYNNIFLFTWSTTTEINTWKFVIEKSYDGNSWLPFRTLSAAGNSNSQLFYSIETNIQYEKFYRLKCIDINGVITYSIIEIVDCENILLNNIDLTPNPTSGNIKIKYTDSLVETYNIQIFDELGRIIYEKRNSTDILLDIDLSRYLSGIYIIKIFNNHGLYISRVVKI